MQEVITAGVFAGFSVLYLKDRWRGITRWGFCRSLSVRFDSFTNVVTGRPDAAQRTRVRAPRGPSTGSAVRLLIRVHALDGGCCGSRLLRSSVKNAHRVGTQLISPPATPARSALPNIR